MKKNFALIAVLTTIIISQSLIAQETFTHPEANVSVTLPAGWLYEIDGPDMIVSTEDETLILTFSIVDSDDIEIALEEIDKMLAETFEEVTINDPEELNFNGLTGIWIDGTADELECVFIIIETPAVSNNLLISGWASPDVIESYINDLEMMIASISPAD